MKWKKPGLHDLNDLKDTVAQGGCAHGAIPDTNCNPGLSAGGDCQAGTGFGEQICETGSAEV